MQSTDPPFDPAFERLYTVMEVAKILGLKLKYVHHLVRTNKLSCVQETTKVRTFRGIHIQEFVQARTRNLLRPKAIDKGPSKALPSPRKGGDKPKSSGDLVRAQLRKEMRSWQS